jgi:hypothetical protein
MINAFHWVHLDEGRHSRNRISDVMVNLLASSAIDRVF